MKHKTKTANNNRVIPSTMASQHPDHAGIPYWLKDAFIKTHHETEESYRTFSELGIDEYKWDWEGKLVDESVIERLLSTYYDYFKKHPLGKEKFLTLRLPNPRVETEFRIGRTLMGILTAASLATQVGLLSPPIFEVILPMTETAEEMIDIQDAFKEIANLKHKLYRLENGAIKHIKIIPLFEQVSTIIKSDSILKKYIFQHKKKFGYFPPYLRPYLARSDPALNSGIVATVLAIKIALSKYFEFEKETGITLYPIIGSASLPFRGGLTPDTATAFTKEYKGIRTALIQSAFRYDYPKEKVIAAIKILHKQLSAGKAENINIKEQKQLIKTIIFFEKYYRQTVEKIAPLINKIASQLPRRRERVQHIGLFGYSRGVGKVHLPRAIGFTAALYSIGVPPELIGTGRGLKKAKKINTLFLIEKYYINLRSDLIRAGRYLNKNILNDLSKKNSVWKNIQEDVLEIEKFLGEKLGPKTFEERQHQILAEKLYTNFKSKQPLTDIISEMSLLRKSLG